MVPYPQPKYKVFLLHAGKTPSDPTKSEISGLAEKGSSGTSKWVVFS